MGQHGDCYDRYLYRMEEMEQSVSLIRQAMSRLPGGPINVEDPGITLPSKTDAMSDMESMIHHFKLITDGIPAPAGDCYMPIEASRASWGCMSLLKKVTPSRFGGGFGHHRLSNLSVIPKLAEGHLVSDLIMINASLDIVLGEIDR